LPDRPVLKPGKPDCAETFNRSSVVGRSVRSAMTPTFAVAKGSKELLCQSRVVSGAFEPHNEITLANDVSLSLNNMPLGFRQTTQRDTRSTVAS